MVEILDLAFCEDEESIQCSMMTMRIVDGEWDEVGCPSLYVMYLKVIRARLSASAETEQPRVRTRLCPIEE